MTKCSLPRSVGSAHRFHQRPVSVLLAVLAAIVRPNKHSRSIVSCPPQRHKRVGLHYIAVFKTRYCKYVTCSLPNPKTRRIPPPRDELGLTSIVTSRRHFSDTAARLYAYGLLAGVRFVEELT